MNTPQTPDYGEPWKMEAYNLPLGESGDFEGVIEIRTRDEIRRSEACNPDDEDEDAFKRIIACVNACSGMADPVAEIEAMRKAIKEAHAIIERYSESAISHANQLMCPECLRIEAFDEDHKDSCSIGKCLTKLQPFINHDLRHTTH